MENLEKIKEVLLKRRDREMADLENNEIESEDYFDIESHSGGNYDDALSLGKEIGEAQFIEELLLILE